MALKDPIARAAYDKAYRLRRYGPPTSGHYLRGCTPQNFWQHVDKTENCWLWMGRKHPFGYGVLLFGREIARDRKQAFAHRVAWELTYGTIPSRTQVCHSCDVPVCCNPAHLFLGTQRDNMADKVKKDRQAKGTKVGCAKLTEDNVREIRACWGVMATQRQLAREFGVHQSIISDIVTRKTWKHVRNEVVE